MDIDPDNLPNDPKKLRRILEQLKAETKALDDHSARLEGQIQVAKIERTNLNVSKANSLSISLTQRRPANSQR